MRERRRLVGQLIGTDEGLHPELADGGGDQLLGVPYQHVDLRVGQFGVHLHALPVGEQREHGLFKYRIPELHGPDAPPFRVRPAGRAEDALVLLHDVGLVVHVGVVRIVRAQAGERFPNLLFPLGIQALQVEEVHPALEEGVTAFVRFQPRRGEGVPEHLFPVAEVELDPLLPGIVVEPAVQPADAGDHRILESLTDAVLPVVLVKHEGQRLGHDLRDLPVLGGTGFGDDVRPVQLLRPEDEVDGREDAVDGQRIDARVDGALAVFRRPLVAVVHLMVAPRLGPPVTGGGARLLNVAEGCLNRHPVIVLRHYRLLGRKPLEPDF